MCRRGISSASLTPLCGPWCVQPALLGKEMSQRSSPRCGICIPPAQRPIGSSRSCKRQKGPCATAPFRLVFKLGILIASYRKLLFKIKAAALSNSGLLLIVPAKTNQEIQLMRGKMTRSWKNRSSPRMICFFSLFPRLEHCPLPLQHMHSHTWGLKPLRGVTDWAR